ncbi:MAG: hypothetical protein HRU46_18395 [Verrucomicrobiales bacterium]|nr:hypothetical protein [Verrucomicrobiales bacterium]
MTFSRILPVLILILLSLSSAQARTFTNTSGTTIEAELIKVTGDQVTLLVKDNEEGLYTDWWVGKNVQFGGAPADALGRFLADHVNRRMDAE